MKRSGLMAAMLAIALIGCASQDETDAASAREAISARLKDPASARFPDMIVIRLPEDSAGNQFVVACGAVNAKNSFGGYNGAERFVVVRLEHHKPQRATETFYAELDEGANKVVMHERMSAFDEMYWNKWCANAPQGSTHARFKAG